MSVMLGFTGTQEGMTLQQRETVQRLVEELNPSIVRHGACKGADAEFSEIAAHAGVPVIVAHPGHDQHGRSPHRAKSFHYTDLLDAERYMKRNRAIIAKSNLIIACPNAQPFFKKGGTFLTTQAALAAKKAVTVVWPDGSYEVDFSFDA